MTTNIKNYNVVRGDSFSRLFTVTKVNPDFNLLTYSDIIFEVRDTASHTSGLLVRLSIGHGINILGEENLILNINMSAESTASMKRDEYSYSLRFLYADGSTWKTYRTGKLLVTNQPGTNHE